MTDKKILNKTEKFMDNSNEIEININSKTRQTLSEWGCRPCESCEIRHSCIHCKGTSDIKPIHSSWFLENVCIKCNDEKYKIRGYN